MSYNRTTRKLAMCLEYYPGSGEWLLVDYMSAADVKRRRLEGYKLHAETVLVFSVSSVEEANVMFGPVVASETDAQLQARVHAMAIVYGWGDVTVDDIYDSTGATLDKLAWRYCLLRMRGV